MMNSKDAKTQRTCTAAVILLLLITGCGDNKEHVLAFQNGEAVVLKELNVTGVVAAAWVRHVDHSDQWFDVNYRDNQGVVHTLMRVRAWQLERATPQAIEK